MEVVVNDTNILIDLFNAGLLQYCGSLGLDFRTLDVVLNEIVVDSQRKAVLALVDDGFLTVHSLSGEQMLRVFDMVAAYKGLCNLSPEDISVLIYAKENGCRLLTGDKTLREKALLENIAVSGLLYLTDMMTSKGVVGAEDMAKALDALLASNSRLPKAQLLARIESLKRER